MLLILLNQSRNESIFPRIFLLPKNLTQADFQQGQIAASFFTDSVHLAVSMLLYQGSQPGDDGVDMGLVGFYIHAYPAHAFLLEGAHRAGKQLEGFEDGKDHAAFPYIQI